MSRHRIPRPENFGAFRERLYQQFESLSPHLKRIADYALGEPNRVAFQTVAQVASEAGVQPSTLVRFARVFGFSGYSDMQALFRLRLIEAESALRHRASECGDRIDGAAEGDGVGLVDAFADASILAIERLKSGIDAESLRSAVRLMEAAGSFGVLGRGRAAPVAACLASGLMGLHRRCVVLDAIPGTTSEQLSAMDPSDLLIVSGFGEIPQPVVDNVLIARRRHLKVLAITDSEFNALARNATACLATGDAELLREPPLAPHLVLAQSLLIALGHPKDREEDPSSGASTDTTA